MKMAFALLVSSFVTFSASAGVLSFKCVSVEASGVHKFDARGAVTVDDFNQVEGVMTVVTQKAQAEHSAQTFDQVKVVGRLRHFGAGEISTEEFDQLILKSDNDYIKTLNLLLNFEPKIASRILTIDNFSYRSNCKIVENFRSPN